MKNLCLILLIAALAGCKKNGDSAPAVSTKSSYISTIAGTGAPGYSGGGGIALKAAINVAGVAADTAGNIYMTDNVNGYVLKISSTGVIDAIAGNSKNAFYGDGGLAIYSSLSSPMGLCVDPQGNVLIADQSNGRIRKINPAGIISTVAGAGGGGMFIDSGAATALILSQPQFVAADAKGNIYITEPSNSRIRKVDANGTMKTIAGKSSSGFGGDGGPAVYARLFQPRGLAFDHDGNLYVADYANQRVRVIDTMGIIRTFAGNGGQGYSGDGGPAINAQLNNPTTLAVDADGNVFIGDVYNQAVRKVDKNGIISTVAGSGIRGFSGDGGPATNCKLNYIMGLAIDAAGNVLIADNGNNRLRRVNK